MTLKIVSYRYTLPNAAVRDINMIVLGMAQNFRQLGLGLFCPDTIAGILIHFTVSG